MDSSLLAALVAMAAGMVSGLLAPTLVARTPEPEAPTPAEDAETARAARPPKVLYATLGQHRWLRTGGVVVGAVVGAGIGMAVGWDLRLIGWCVALPLLGALSWIDWHTKLLPNWLMWPLIWAMTCLVPLAVGLSDGWSSVPGVVAQAAGAWLFYLILHILHPAGIGFGDVRLSWPLGLLLASAGGAELLAGLWLGFALGGVIGVLLGGARGSLKRTIPFGPFMVIGAVLGLFLGPILLSGMTR